MENKMKLARLVAPLAALGALTAAGTAAADTSSWWTMDQPHFFVGGGIGYDWMHNDNVPNQPDDFSGRNTTYKGVVGWSFNRIWSLEGQYIDFGTNDDGDNRIRAHGWTTDVVASFPVNPHVVPYVKAGAFFWNGDSRFVAAGVQEERDGNGTDFTYGGGVKFPVTNKLDVRVEYERFAFGDFERDSGAGGGAFNRADGPDANMASAAVVFNF
jgi:opacity protein-like surface antigen